MSTTTLRFEPLGDQAVFVQGGSEAAALAFAATVRDRKFPWVEDVVQSYCSVVVFYRPTIGFEAARAALTSLVWTSHESTATGTLHIIPCCYDLGLDFDRVSEHTRLTREQIIEAHMGTTYTVFAIGFCPGFPYLGYLPESLTGVPRLEAPRLKVEAGSVGLTGRQTGIYTEPRPGGWNILGRTPLELVNVADGYFPIRTGDRVRFQRIDERKFNELRGKRLE